MIKTIASNYLKGIIYIMKQPSWKNRRRYILASFVLGAFMLVTAAVGSLTGTIADAGSIVTGGVTLISLILTSYIFAAVWEDKGIMSKQANADADG
jgi:hypothetical protein